MYHQLTATILVAVISSCLGQGYPFLPFYEHPFDDVDTPDTSDLLLLHANRALTGTAGGVASSAGTGATFGSTHTLGLLLGQRLCDASLCRLRSCPDEMIQPTGLCICKSDMCDVNPLLLGGSLGQRSALYSRNLVG